MSFLIAKNIKPLPSPRGKVPTSSCGGTRMRVDRVTASSVRQLTYKLQSEYRPDHYLTDPQSGEQTAT
jgi:hypothetical protein